MVRHVDMTDGLNHTADPGNPVSPVPPAVPASPYTR